MKTLLALTLMAVASVAVSQDYSILGTGVTVRDTAVGPEGFIHVTGYVEGCGLIAVNAHQPTCGSAGDAFVAKITPQHDAVVYATYLGGSGDDDAYGVSTDPDGNAYIVGQTTSPDFPTPGGIRPGPGDGEGTGFAAKFSPTGALVYSTLLWHTSSIAWDVAVTAEAAYIAGCRSVDHPDFFDVCAVYVGKLNLEGTEFLYELVFGGTGSDVAQQVEVDSLGQALLVGVTSSPDFPVFPPTPGVECAPNSPMAAKVNAAGDDLIWATCGYQPQAKGQVTIGLYDSGGGRFLLQNKHAGGRADPQFRFGPTRSPRLPVTGDWNRNGQTTIGLYDQREGQFYLGNELRWTNAHLRFRYGPKGVDWTPLAGDWNNDGTTTVGLYDPVAGKFFLRNSNTPGGADIAFRFGPANFGWLPIVGDWNGDGQDTIGLYAPEVGAFFLKNRLTGGAADVAFRFGATGMGWRPLAGDWDNDGLTTVGLYDPAGSRYHLLNSQAGGVADVGFRYGPMGAGWLAIAGDWDGQ